MSRALKHFAQIFALKLGDAAPGERGGRNLLRTADQSFNYLWRNEKCIVGDVVVDEPQPLPGPGRPIHPHDFRPNSLATSSTEMM